MRITYDPQTDMAYIYLREMKDGEVKKTIPCDYKRSGRVCLNLDLDAEGHLVGIEVFEAQLTMPQELLRLATPERAP